MAYFNMTNITGAENYLQIVQAVNNDLVGGAFGVMFLIGVWIIMFMSFKTRYMAKQSFAVASFVTMIMSFIFMALNLIPDLLIFLPIAMTAIGLVMVVASGE